MKNRAGKDILFGMYLIVLVAMAFIYFTVPERVLFLKNQLKWWGEMWRIVVGSITPQ